MRSKDIATIVSKWTVVASCAGGTVPMLQSHLKQYIHGEARIILDYYRGVSWNNSSIMKDGSRLSSMIRVSQMISVPPIVTCKYDTSHRDDSRGNYILVLRTRGGDNHWNDGYPIRKLYRPPILPASRRLVCVGMKL